MKKTIQIMGVIVLLFISAAVFAQQTEETTKPSTENTKVWNAQENPVVSEINAKYETKLIPAKKALTIEDIYPAIGTYESTTNPEAASIVITNDADNKGFIWISGLPQGKIKAMLRKSPATYKIPAQKTEDGKDVAEGTLIFDKEMNTLSIAIGKDYNAENPSLVFITPQEKENVAVDNKKVKNQKITPAKIWVYTGTKVEKETVKN
jgi:hypothetical protein